MVWIPVRHDRWCETCGTGTERWVRVMRNRLRTGEVTFCPVCSPEVKMTLEIPETDDPADSVPPAS